MRGAGAPDFFYREAQRLGYLARSAFKLLQIQKQYKLITLGSSVLDLGCAPGAWLQVSCQSLGPLKNGGSVVEQKVKVPPLHCDARQKGFSVILSDMCPPVSGITTKDAALSAELGMQAVDLAIGRAALAHSDGDTKRDGQSDSDCGADDNGLLQAGGHLNLAGFANHSSERHHG
ncbi:hypothetical protein GH714_036000 [Hevea brasiliensis]|uniref:rRNA methyltransferase 2, mitochondrial n=1 Tax=Hevea brasiliensis TaxID=3981 RepID=A0A6A6L7N4_HEVBR|nr:hypothetical protein GH714_036000 [Hevea brasiliensis]